MGYSTFQKLHPLSLLAQLISHQVTGHFKLSTHEVSWSLFLSQGKLNFATNTASAFDRLDNHLRRLSDDIPTLVSSVRVQLRLLFEQADDNSVDVSPDYQAIFWLFEQSHITKEQSTALIEALAFDVLEPFLEVQEGNYELAESESLDPYPQFCQLDLRPIVETCQKRRRQRHAPSYSTYMTEAAVIMPERYGSSGYPSSLPITDLVEPIESRPSPLAYEVDEPTQLASQPLSQPSSLSNQTVRQSPTQSESERRVYTIACIDDSPTVLNAIQGYLNDRSLSVVCISDPVKALMQIMRSKPDLILLDVTMPNLDGYELCSLLRRHPQFKDTPIVMVTSNTGLIDRAKAKLVRASGYLTKPFNQSDLLKMVFMHLPAANA
jgi:twitching motility two-component system response regulator PilG